jgi:hypothetical protein
LSLGDGNDSFIVETKVNFQLSGRQLAGTQSDTVFASLAGTDVQLVRQGQTNRYVGTIAEPQQVGRYVLSISASTRVDSGQGGNFVSSAVGRSVEVRVVP